ncbi:ATP-binding protein [Streptomyces sp. NPDC058284]|uniref:ATP-binding protein n=1 Tax=unclassified Streptomyces TaxID=2593676 RepID=UPI00365C29B3
MTTTATKTNVNGAPGYAAQLPCLPEAVQRARAFVSGVLDAWGMKETLAGEVIVSELLTNVVVHTSTDLTTVAIQRDGTCQARIEVADASHVPPHVVDASGGAECGRGLQLVALLSSRWGYEDRPWGKVTWAELSLCAESGR